MGFTDHRLAGKTLIDYTNLFSPYDFKNNNKIISDHIKNWWNPSMYQNLSDQTQFRLNKINEIKDSFIAKFEKEKQWVNCLVNILLHLTVLTRSWLLYLQQMVSIVSFTSVIGGLVWIVSLSFSFVLSITTGIKIWHRGLKRRSIIRCYASQKWIKQRWNDYISSVNRFWNQ